MENTTDEEAPLLTSYDGIEFSSCERPSKLLLGRASFKLKISQVKIPCIIIYCNFIPIFSGAISNHRSICQLSSKCDNRLFLIRFCIPKFGNYPFLETYTRPIRCISRSRNTRLSTLVWKKPTYALHQLSLSQSSAMDDGSLEHLHSGNEAKANPLMKRFRVGHDKISVSLKGDPTLEQSGEECNSHVWTANQVVTCFSSNLILS